MDFSLMGSATLQDSPLPVTKHLENSGSKEATALLVAPTDSLVRKDVPLAVDTISHLTFMVPSMGSITTGVGIAGFALHLVIVISLVSFLPSSFPSTFHRSDPCASSARAADATIVPSANTASRASKRRPAVLNRLESIDILL